MSKNINVNPGQYKVKGRERQGEDIVPERHKQELAKAREEAHPASKKRNKKKS
jgi:hypothetical protein